MATTPRRYVRKNSLVDSDNIEPVSHASNVTPPELNEGGFAAGDVQAIAPSQMNDAVAVEKFMNEKIEIEIEPGTEENDPLFIHLGHNGITQMVERGKPQVIKRKFFYSALMGKQVVFQTAFGKKNSGEEFNNLTRNVKSAYRTRLITDNNPQGGNKWVNAVMREATGMH